jgi:hypothetical protein
MYLALQAVCKTIYMGHCNSVVSGVTHPLGGFLFFSTCVKTQSVL